MPIEFLRHRVDISIIELSEHAYRAVVFERNASLDALTQEHADRRVERGRKLMLGHPGRRQRIANVVLNGLSLQSVDFKQAAMITEAEDGKAWSLFQLAAGALRFTISKQREDAVVDAGNKRLEFCLHAFE